MKTLHRYLLRQVVASLVMTLLVFTFVLLVGNALREILPLLVNGQASFMTVAEAFGLLIPFVLAFALPMAMLTSVLLVFGRFSADQELTAARASGVSLVSLVTPILFLSLLLCGVSALVNMEIAPACRVAYNGLRTDMRTALANLKLPAGQYLEFPPAKDGDPTFTIYTRKNHNQNLEDVIVDRAESKTNFIRVLAPTGHFGVDTNAQQLVLTLTNVTSVEFPSGMTSSGEEARFPVDLKPNGKNTISMTDMTFEQLQEEMRKRQFSPPVQLNKTSPDDQHKRKKVQQKVTDSLEPIRVQLHKQIAFSFACFGFTLIGIPLGIRVHRRETNIGVAIALALVGVYYTFLVVAQSMSSHAEYAPHLLIWLPNFIFQAVGAVLLWRANKGI